MSDYDRTFNGDAKIKLQQLFNEGMAVMQEVEDLQEGLNDIPFFTISVGSEGAKEKLYAGAAAPSLQGKFGKNKSKCKWICILYT